MSSAYRYLLAGLLGALASPLAWAGPPGPSGWRPPPDEPVLQPQRTVVSHRWTSIGNLGLNITNLGYVGNLLNPAAPGPSCEYPLHGNVEHLFVGGLWIGGVDSEGNKRVSAGAEDTAAGQLSPKREYGPRVEDGMVQLSSNPLSPYFDLDALADEQYVFRFDDLNAPTNQTTDPHAPLGLEVHATALAYAPGYADDFVILKYDIVNISDQEITDVYLGWYSELTVGNTTITIPGDATNGWRFVDDYKGVILPGSVPGDPDIHAMYARDDDGENGLAVSWMGVRLLGTSHPTDVFSFRKWQFSTSALGSDALKYDLMKSGQIDVGQGESISGQPIDFDPPNNWVQVMAVGPWPLFAPGDTIGFTVAYVAGLDSVQMVQNSQVAQSTFNAGFKLAAGPPSPRLNVSTANHSVLLRWKPGLELPPDQYDPVLASPEYHRNEFTRELDFQGYRIYRLRADSPSGDPREQASLIAEFDVPDTIGFNTGLPPLNPQGEREFVDTGVLDGYKYTYSVTSFAARNAQLGLPELESGFNENSIEVIPGSAAGDGGVSPPVGVYPNPYRAAGDFDRRLPGGEPAELGRKIYFTNVPADARIEVFNLSGSLIDRFEHHDAASGQVAWDMLSEATRAIAPGLYVYVVEDLRSGEMQRGKLVILK